MTLRLTGELIGKLDLFIIDPKELPMQYKYLGMCAHIAGINAETGQRATMGPPAIARAMPLFRPEMPLVTTGLAAITADYTHKTVIPATGIVKLKQVYSDYQTKVVIHGSDGVMYDVDVDTFVKTHEKFGFPMVYTDYFNNLTIGDSVIEGDLLAYSPQSESGMETNTVNLVGLAGYFNQASEDAIIMSKSGCKKLETVTYHERVLTIKKDDLLLNLYGDEENYQPIPLVGEYIRDDMALIAKRNMANIMLSPAIMDSKSLMKYDESFDTVKYGPDINCKVISIQVINSEGKAINKFPFTVQCLYDIAEQQRNENRQLINVYKTNGFPECSPRLTLNLVHANALINSRSLKFKVVKLNNLRIRLILEERIIPNIKSKISGEYGNKGIICDVIEDKYMPVTPEGIRVDYIYEAGSVLNRNNSPVTTIGGLGMQCHLLHRRIKKMYNVSYDNYIDYETFAGIDNKIHNEVFKLLLKFYELGMSPLYESFKLVYEKSPNDMLEILFDMFTNGVRTQEAPPNISGIIPMERLRNSEFTLPKVKLTNLLTEEEHGVSFKDEMSLTIQSILVQNKLGDRIMACTTPFENHYELPTSLGSNDRDNRQLNYSAIKLIGNTEKRTLEANVNIEAISEYMEIGKDPQVRNFAYGTLLRQDKFPVKAVDRKLIKFGNDPFTRMYQSVTQCMGFLPEEYDSGYTESDKFEDEVREERWNYEGDI